MRDAKTLKPTKPEVKYLVKHDEKPNRAIRRQMQKIVKRRHRAFDTWWRGLERAGIDPRRVLLARQIREGLLSVRPADEAGAAGGVDPGNSGDGSGDRDEVPGEVAASE